MTIYITRDSDGCGSLSDTVDVWTQKPIRAKLTIDCGYVWLPKEADGELRGRNADELGHVRNVPCKYAVERYGTIPDNDREMIVRLIDIA